MVFDKQVLIAGEVFGDGSGTVMTPSHAHTPMVPFKQTRVHGKLITGHGGIVEQRAMC